MEHAVTGQPTIGSYSIGKTIGQGTFGKVKLGHHICTGERVAIKILEKRKICDVSDVERVARELHILKLIRHPHIIQLYEVSLTQIIETPTKLFLIMEFANGGELFDFIVASSRLKESLACRLFLQLISGIEYIHQLGVVHRDLKPENLLLDNRKCIKVVDFGLSNTYQPNEQLKTACGSPCYAAPEMIAGKRYHGLQSDLWSAGIILFAMTCGYLPFEDPDTSKLYKKILAGDFKCPGFLSAELKDLLSGLLDTEPATRLTISQIRGHPWCAQVEVEVPSGILVGYENILVDHEILAQLAAFGYDLDHTQRCIEANNHNSVTAGYYLLLKKHIDDGGDSIANYSRINETILRPESNSQTHSFTPRPPLFKLTQEPSLAGVSRVRKYVETNKRTSSRRSSRKASSSKETRSRNSSLRSAASKQRSFRLATRKASRPPLENMTQTVGKRAADENVRPRRCKSYRTASM